MISKATLKLQACCGRLLPLMIRVTFWASSFLCWTQKKILQIPKLTNGPSLVPEGPLVCFAYSTTPLLPYNWQFLTLLMAPGHSLYGLFWLPISWCSGGFCWILFIYSIILVALEFVSELYLVGLLLGGFLPICLFGFILGFFLLILQFWFLVLVVIWLVLKWFHLCLIFVFCHLHLQVFSLIYFICFIKYVHLQALNFNFRVVFVEVHTHSKKKPLFSQHRADIFCSILFSMLFCHLIV